jgi:hypothetical protein
MELTGGTGLPAGERERGKEGAGWAGGQEEGRGAGVLGQKGRKEGRCDSISFFQTYFPNAFLFLQIFSCTRRFDFLTLITKKMHQNVCNKSITLNLY